MPAITVRTTVQKHLTREYAGKTFYTFVGQDGNKYGTKSKHPPPVGSYIQFDYTISPKGYFEVDNWAFLPAEGATSNVAKAAVAGAKAVSKDDYWANREERDIQWQERQAVTQATIELQSCRNTAVEFVKLLLEREAVPVPKTKADQEEYIVAMLNRYTNLFLEENNKKKETNNAQAPAAETKNEKSEAASESDDTAWA